MLAEMLATGNSVVQFNNAYGSSGDVRRVGIL